MEESLVVRLQCVVLKILFLVLVVVVAGGVVTYPVGSLDDQFKINGSIFPVSEIMTTERRVKIIQIKFRQFISFLTPPF